LHRPQESGCDGIDRNWLSGTELQRNNKPNACNYVNSQIKAAVIREWSQNIISQAVMRVHLLRSLRQGFSRFLKNIIVLRPHGAGFRTQVLRSLSVTFV
jgi:hypothetical protein